MVLPIPVADGHGEDAVKFVDLSGYPDLFQDMAKGFPADHLSGGDPFGGARAGGALLEVHQVGAFDASFVPTVSDFGRLDAQFRMPAGTWEKLPGYREFGFVVFKL